ncbi:transmembrane protein 170A-like [Amphiura filiformis]|uniref:transmembrane protein 170A-like n=1 Tax=Amphiura filiformis TaxID=82378 RepID=UPI003B2127A0
MADHPGEMMSLDGMAEHVVDEVNFGISFPSVRKVITLETEPLANWIEMWYQIFLWYLFSSFLVHSGAALVAVWALHRHKYGRFYAVLILVMGFIGPITGGIATSAIIAGLFKTTTFKFYPMYAMVCGWGQTIMMILISYTRILATL